VNGKDSLVREKFRMMRKSTEPFMRKETWKALDDMYSQSPILRAEGVKAVEVDAAELEVGVKLPEDYKEFVCRYGGAIVGPFPIYGLRNVEPMGRRDSSMPAITKSFREYGWRGVEKWAVISTDHCGNPVGLDAMGKVWISDHDYGSIELLVPNFEGYIREWCLKLAD
jgi:hypothetical protein